MDRESAISKIKKCLAFARSADTNEANTAMRQAQKLMEAFKLNEQDVSLADVSEARTPVQSNAMPLWEVCLARMIAEAFGCERYVTSDYIIGARGARTWGRLWVFVGVSGAADVAQYAMEVLARQCAKDRADYVGKQRKSIKAKTKTARGDAFALAWVSAVSKAVERLAGQEKDTLLLQTYMQRNHPDMGSIAPKDRTVSRHVNDDSYRQGSQAGAKARLDRGIGGKGEQAQLEHNHA